MDLNPITMSAPAWRVRETCQERHVITRDRVDQTVSDPLPEHRQRVPPATPVFGELLGARNAHAIGATGRMQYPRIVGVEHVEFDGDGARAARPQDP